MIGACESMHVCSVGVWATLRKQEAMAVLELTHLFAAKANDRNHGRWLGVGSRLHTLSA